jgi:hypothetical protein
VPVAREAGERYGADIAETEDADLVRRRRREGFIAGRIVQPRVSRCRRFRLRRVTLQCHALSDPIVMCERLRTRSGKFYAAMEDLQSVVARVRRG